MNQVSGIAKIEQPLDPALVQPQLRGAGLLIARVAWILLALGVVVILITALPGYIQHINSGVPAHGPVVNPATRYVVLRSINSLASIFAGMLSFSLALLLFRKKFENPAVAAVSFYLLLYAAVMTGMLEAWGSYWLADFSFVNSLQAMILTTPTVALLVLFPNGRFVPPWSRWLLLISIPWNVFTLWLLDFSFGSNSMGVILILALIWISLPISGLYTQIYRYRFASTAEERQQTKWVLYGFSLWVGYIILSSAPYFYITNLPTEAQLPWWEPLSELFWWLSQCILPVTLAIAILRSRLWDINLVINRTLVYGTLTLTTMGIYVFVVGGLGSLFQLVNRSLIAFLATGLIAVLFQPLRERLQRWVNRLMYGERDDPVAVLTQLGKELEHTGSPEVALTSITQTVARSLKLPYVAIELGSEGELAAVYGMPQEEVLRFPLTYQSETTGNLVLAPRSPGEIFSNSDKQLLENISHQAGAAAHAAKLTADLRQSRQRLVTTREEERRRLRRDLHDGLGPTLASMTLKLDAVHNLLQRDPDKADELIIALKKQTQETIKDVRTLVYDLRPPALDELGLIGAVQSYLTTQTPGDLYIQLEVSEDLPVLPAAYEVALYRIILEGVTNIIRHAQAENARVCMFSQPGELVLEIIDDGIGLPAGKKEGVGLSSMRERAEELGGSFVLYPVDQGTHLQASLPLDEGQSHG